MELRDIYRFKEKKKFRKDFDLASCTEIPVYNQS